MKNEPGVIGQPPVYDTKYRDYDKDMLCREFDIMKWSVVYKAKKFDIPLYESDSKPAAKIYQSKLKTLTKSIKMKRTKNVRRLKEDYVTEEILISISV